MKRTELIMGMPITVEIVDKAKSEKQKVNGVEEIIDYFRGVDERFSTYKETSEISLINAGKIALEQYSETVKEIFRLAEQTKKETDGYFDIQRNGTIDPSGIVKGWAIQQAADLLKQRGFTNFYIDAGGDIQVSGRNKEGKQWTVGIRNPFNKQEIVKALRIEEEGVATSGTYIRGEHIYNPRKKIPDLSLVKQAGSLRPPVRDDNRVVSLTVIGPNVYEADRFATAAFAMGEKGIQFIESRDGLEGYMIDKNGIATMTTGLGKYTI
jgi:thiamine biosynthesis lipoprotein